MGLCCLTVNRLAGAQAVIRAETMPVPLAIVGLEPSLVPGIRKLLKKYVFKHF